MESQIYQIKPNELQTAAPFKDLFPLDKGMVETLAEDMSTNGFQAVYPLAVWNGVVVDGHTRLAAAKRARISRIECAYMEFQDEEEALLFAIKSQRHRRNLTEADLVRCLVALDHRQTAGRPSNKELAQIGANSEPPKKVKSAKKTAEAMGISTRQVERIRAVLDHAPEEVKEALSQSKISVNAAYLETQAIRNPKPLPAPRPEPEVSSDDATEPSPAFGYEIGLMKTLMASCEKDARERFVMWCRSSPESEILSIIAIQKSEVSK